MLTQNSPLYYHPIRIQQTRPFARKIAGRLVKKPGLLTLGEFEDLQGSFSPTYSAEIMKVPFGDKEVQS